MKWKNYAETGLWVFETNDMKARINLTLDQDYFVQVSVKGRVDCTHKADTLENAKELAEYILNNPDDPEFNDTTRYYRPPQDD